MEVTAWAPGRVNIVGEHTDYNNGLVLPIAIDLGTWATVGVNTSSGIEITSAQFPGERFNVTDTNIQSLPHWARYVAGSALTFMKSTDITSGLRVHVDSTVPLGAGLSSSASVECAIIVALDELFHANLPKLVIAELAQQAEHVYANVPCGLMDQVASMFGQIGEAILFDVKDMQIESLAFNPESSGVGLLVCDTKIRHSLAQGEYAIRRSQCNDASALLGLSSLRDVVSIADLDELPEILRKRARHVVTENTRVLSVVGAATSGDWKRVGDLISKSHESLRDDFEVSIDEIDHAVSAAQNHGALGARIVGGGFGGSILILCENDNFKSVSEAVVRSLVIDGIDSPTLRTFSPTSGAHVVADSKDILG